MIILKILAAPVMVALSLLAAMVTFLFCVASAVCELGCIVLTLLSLILFIGGQTVGGIVFLVLAFLVSPFGVPAIAEWLVDKLHSAKFTLRDFITGCYFGTKCPEVIVFSVEIFLKHDMLLSGQKKRSKCYADERGARNI